MDESEYAQAQTERINRQIEDVQRRAVQAQEFAQQAEQVRGSASSPRDELTVTVDSLGRLSDLTLTDHALGLGTDGLAAAIVEAAGRARTTAGEQVVTMAADLWGADSQTVAALRDTYLPADVSGPEPGQPDPFGFGR